MQYEENKKKSVAYEEGTAPRCSSLRTAQMQQIVVFSASFLLRINPHLRTITISVPPNELVMTGFLSQIVVPILCQ
jgi:hypothetical protein